MDANDSSPPPPTTKVASANRSITSSTTAASPPDLLDLPLLNEEDQFRLLEMMQRGCGATIAANQCGFHPASVFRTLNNDVVFRQLWIELDFALSGNVVAALYKSAMNGSVPAQIFWLKNNPPLGWGERSFEAPQFDEWNLDDEPELSIRPPTDQHERANPKAEARAGADQNLSRQFSREGPDRRSDE